MSIPTEKDDIARDTSLEVPLEHTEAFEKQSSIETATPASPPTRLLPPPPSPTPPPNGGLVAWLQIAGASSYFSILVLDGTATLCCHGGHGYYSSGVVAASGVEPG